MRKLLGFSAIAAALSLSGCAFDPMVEGGSGGPDLAGVAQAGDAPGPRSGAEDSAYLDHAPFVLAEGQLNPGDIQVTDTGLYWVNQTSDGPVLAHSTLTGSRIDYPHSTIAGEIYDARAAGGTLLYAEFGQSELDSTPLDGGYVTKLAVFDAPPLSLVVDGEYAFVATADGCVVKAWLGGGDITPISCVVGTPLAIARSGDQVFWSIAEGALYRASVDGGEAVLVAKDDFGEDLVVDDDLVYWANPSTGEIRAVDHDGTGDFAVMGVDQGTPTSLAGDASRLYFAVKETGSVWQIDKASGTQTLLAKDQGAPDELVAAGGRIYWGNQLGGEIVTFLTY